MRIRFGIAAVVALCTLALASLPALALDPRDPPIISCVGGDENQVTLKIEAGATGALAGFSVQWMTLEDFENNGNQWFDSADPRLCKLSLSGQPSLQHPGASRWDLQAGQSQTIIIGDINFDETGVSGQNCGLDLLECGTAYVFRAFAHAGRRMARSPWTPNLICWTADCPVEDCTHTQGFWKNHGPGSCKSGNNANEWPNNGNGLGLGSRQYTDAQVCTILNRTGAGGNCLVSLAHQLISAKFSVMSFTGPVCQAVTSLIACADQVIGNRDLLTASVSGGQQCNATQGLCPSIHTLAGALNTFNNGGLSGCPSLCDNNGLTAPTDVEAAPWGKVKTYFR